MHRLETVGDFLVFFFIALLFIAIGALAIAYPSRYVSDNLSDYARVTGILKSVKNLGDRSHSRRIEFTIESHGRIYGSRLTPFRGGADQWIPGQTRLWFLIEKDNPDESDFESTIQAYALSDHGADTRSFEDDINQTNHLAGRKFGMGLLLIGSLLFGGGILSWRRRLAT